MHTMTARRLVSSVLLAVYLSSCTSWQPLPVSPEQAIAEDYPSKIRLTLSDGSRLEMEQPRIVGDTVRGAVRNNSSLVERDVLLADIVTLKVRKSDVAKSILLFSGLVAVASLALMAESYRCSSSESSVECR